MNILFITAPNYEKIGGLKIPATNYKREIERLGNMFYVSTLPYSITGKKESDKWVEEIKRTIAEKQIEAVLVYGLNQPYFVAKHIRQFHPCVRFYAFLADSMSLFATSTLRNSTQFKDKANMWLRSIVYSYRELACLKKFKKAIYVSNVDARYVKRTYGNRISAEIDVVVPGINAPEQLQQDPQKATSDEAALKIGCLTNFGPYEVEHDLRPILDVYFPEILKAYPNATLYIAGRGASEKLQAEMKRQQNVTYLGFVENLSDFYNLVDIVISTVKKECGVLNRILEAWGYAKPVVGYTRNFAAFEDAIEGRHYLVADCAEDFISQIGRIYKKEVNCSEMGKEAHQFVASNYTWRSRAEQMLVLLKD